MVDKTATGLPLEDRLNKKPELEEEEDGVIATIDDDEEEVEEVDEDGGKIAKIDGEKEAAEVGEFYDNLIEFLDPNELDTLANKLLEDIKFDRESRGKHDEMYAQSIKRTGLGDEAPGGATFPGASKAVYPMLSQAAIDYESRAIKELFPSSGPVKMFVPGKEPTPDRLKKAERKKEYMNWQFTVQMPEFRSEFEQLLTQQPLGGSQYMRLTPDQSRKRKRPVPLYVPSDEIIIPFAASNFYTAERQTWAEKMTDFEFQERVRDGMYADIPAAMVKSSATIPEQSKSEKATDKVEGKEEQGTNRDGQKVVYEVSTFHTFIKRPEGDPENIPVPYRISIDQPSRKIVAVVRNWEADDEFFERMQWIVEFPFFPWRGAYSVGLGQYIGSLSGAATGALRALLDAALIQNSQVLAKLKGTNTTGQSKNINPTEVIEIEGSVSGTKDIRELLMAIPFPGPSATLFELLGFLTDTGGNAIHVAMEKISEGRTDMPVGTTLALIEEGMRVMAAIHLRNYHAMDYLIRILHRIDRMYLTDEDLKNDIGEVLAHASDFDGPFDCIPVADPEIFSDVQRIAQAQIVADRALVAPDLYDRRETEKMLLERAHIPGIDRLLIPQPKPIEMNAVNENVAMTLGRPVAAFPEQDHLAHLQVLLDFLTSPVLGQLPVIAPTFIGAALGHIKEHVVYWYVSEYHNLVQGAVFEDLGEEGITEVMKERDPEVRKELDKTLAVASQYVKARSIKLFSGLPPIIQQAQQVMAQFAPPMQIPTDPNKMAAVEAKKQGDMLHAQTEEKKIQAKAQDNVIQLQAKAQDRAAVTEVEFAKLSAEERATAVETAQKDAQHAQEIAARLQELAERERGEDERTAAKLASAELVNVQDNTTALKIAAAEIESGEKTDRSTGNANPAPSGTRNR